MATRTISTRLAVEGEAEYKASLKNINSELGTLKSELKLVESEFSGQANSLAALEAKGDALGKMYETQSDKVDKLREALQNAQKAQQTYSDRMDAARANIQRCEEALEALGNESGDTSEEQQRLTAELEAQNKELTEAQSYYDSASRACNSWQTQLNNAQSDLNKLGDDIEQNNKYLDEARSSTDGCASSIDEYGKAVNDAGGKTDTFADKLKSGLVTGAKAAGAAIAAVGTATVAAVNWLLDLADSTEEYRESQARLNTAFESAGYSTQTATDAYRTLYSVIGDTGTATEAAQLLAQLATSEQDVSTWGDIAAGVVATFGDALPINSLVEASNETAKVGTVTGALADALNWVGISEDEFNDKLAACADETERANLITETLSATYRDAGEAFRENNATIIAAREAQAELDDTLARLGGTVADVKNELITEFAPALADVVDAFVDVINGVEGAEDALGDAISDMIGAAADKLPELLEFGSEIVINLLEGLAEAAPQLAEAATSLLTTLAEGLISALPQLGEAAMQIVSGLASGIGEALPTLLPTAVEAITQFVQTLIDNIPLLVEGAMQLVTGLAQGLIEAIPVLLEAVPTIVESLVTALLESAPMIAEAGVSLLTSLITNLPDIITTICEALPQIVESVISTLLSHIPELVQAGVDLLTALITNLPTIISTITSALPELISSIVSTIIDHVPDLVETGVTLLTSLITNLPQIIAELVAAMPEIISGMVNALADGVSEFVNIGENLVRGLWEGIQNLAGWLWDKATSWASSIWDGVKSVFDVNSPSRKFEWLSEMNIAGAVRGIELKGDDAVKAYSDLTKEMLDEVESGMKGVDAALSAGAEDVETSFTAKAAIKQVEDSIPALDDPDEPRGSSRGGDTSVNNVFHIERLVVREEADVKKVAKELDKMQRTKTRGKGVVT